MDKFEASRAKCGVKFDQIYALKFDARGSNLKNNANLTQPPKGKFK
ncbi:hypothetical protein [uncultured Campylobacter sp.]|nr:hypothetical protein [uncultured Campylobacter sp.]